MRKDNASKYSKITTPNKEQQKIYFIGIGGIGVSSLAQYYLNQGWQVSGSDSQSSIITELLEQKGAQILIGHSAKNIKNPDLIVHTVAIPENNPELKFARKNKIKTLTYAQALGEISKKYRTIAVAGSHGKSTTTALLALTLVRAGFDPTVILGTKLKEWNSNFRLGKSDWLVIEADEYNKSFHNYHPEFAIILNTDKEHLDTYKNFNGVVAGFRKFAKQVNPKGLIVANYKDKGLQKVFGEKWSNDTKRPKLFWYNKSKITERPIQIPGKHNQENAEAVYQLAKKLKISDEIINKSFKKYTGTWRRFEKLKSTNPKYSISSLCTDIYSDYAHHPTEVRATLSATRDKYPKRKIICVFEPHHEDRFNRSYEEFKSAFDEADATFILPIYKVAGRRSRISKTSKDLVRDINKPSVKLARDVKDAISQIESMSTKSEKKLKPVIIFMGAGSIDSQIRKIL